jgi:hypothetical protein
MESWVAPDDHLISDMHIRLRNPELARDLVETLRDAACIVEIIDDVTCRVSYQEVADRRQADMEMRFFLRAWQLKHGGGDALVLA